MKDLNVKWNVSLSNGKTFYENKNEFFIIEGELSPWQRLLAYLEKENVSITSLSLYHDDGRRWNLPSAGNNPKFKIFNDAEKPESYKFFRKAGFDMDFGGGEKREELFAVIEAIYKNKTKLQIWVNENNPKISWSIKI